MSILGIGTDLVKIARIRSVYERWGARFLARVFTEEEQAYALRHLDPVPALAKRFAAKEAAAKALGSGIAGGVQFRDFSVSHDAAGQPQLTLSRELRAALAARGSLFAGAESRLSLSDEADYALAFVIFFISN